MYARGGYIYCKEPPYDKHLRPSVLRSVFRARLWIKGEYLFGNVELRVSTLKRREAVSIEKSTWWHKQLWGEFITRPRWLLMTYFGCFPWQSNKRGRERERWLESIGVESKIWRDYYCCPGLSAPPAIASQERKKRERERDQKEEKRRFWLKVWGKWWIEGKNGGRRSGGESDAERERVRRRGGGSMTSIVFHLCVVDVLINSVRFSFWRLHGVFHADSGGSMWVANRTERKYVTRWLRDKQCWTL